MADGEGGFHHLLGPGVPTRNFAKGKTIFKEGDLGDEFFVVVRGKVEIRSGDRHFETLGPDGIFGEMALIDDSPRSATAVALTDVTVAPIKENQFLFLVKNTPFFALKRDARSRPPVAPPEQSGLTDRSRGSAVLRPVRDQSPPHDAGRCRDRRRSVLERQAGILFGDHGRGMLRSKKMIEFAELDPGLERVVVGKDVQEIGQPPGKALRRPDASQRHVRIAFEIAVVAL